MEQVFATTIQPPTQKSEILVGINKVLVIIQLIIGITKSYYSLNDCVYELVACLVLWLSIRQFSYQQCVIYIVLCQLSIFLVISEMCIKIQRNNQIMLSQYDLRHLKQKYWLTISIVSLQFYIISIYYAFQSYKEYKGISYDVFNLANKQYDQQKESHTNNDIGNKFIQFDINQLYHHFQDDLNQSHLSNFYSINNSQQT